MLLMYKFMISPRFGIHCITCILAVEDTSSKFTCMAVGVGSVDTRRWQSSYTRATLLRW